MRLLLPATTTTLVRVFGCRHSLNRSAISQTRFQSKSSATTSNDPNQSLETSKSRPSSAAAGQDASATFSPALRMYAAKIDTRKREDFENAQKTRRYHKLLGLLLGTFVFGVYGYTMFAISQEKFLDDFDVPEPPDPGYQEANKNKRPSH
jgi:hypothetical protein